jgi:alpha-tubulin suppressor-like RCC1 family protein
VEQPVAADVSAVATSFAHLCVLSAQGRVLCWGANNDRGRLGRPTTSLADPPIPVDVGLLDVVSISTRAWATCAVTQAGEVYCWGDNRRGQVGDGTSVEERPTPVLVVGLEAPAP